MFSLLKPTVSLVLRPHVLTLMLQPTTQRSPTAYLRKPTISVTCLVPDIFGAESLDQ